MILFSDANGTIQANFGTPVYQGSANSNSIYLIAPYAPAASVMVGFQLPDGTAVAPVDMTPLNAVPGVQNANGTTFAGWSYVLPATVTAKYGTVTAQFFFYAPTGESTNPTSIIATSATSFQIGRGAAAVLPDTPDADVYESILSNIAQLQTDLNGGYYGARAIFPWSNGATYGANEITFYPSIGTYGAFVKSVQAGNTNHAPYTDGVINSAWWSEVVNFNTVTDDFFAEIKAVQTAAEAAQSAAETAQGKAEEAQAAAEEAESNAQAQAQAAASSATAAESSASDAESAKEAAQTAQNAAESAAENAQAYAGQASGSAIAAAQSASAAAASANRAQEIVNGIGSVYKPVGSIAFSALPATPAAAQQGYVYNITDAFTTDARFVEGAGKEYPAGTNVAVVLNGSAYMYDALSGNVDLSNYAQTNGTYPNMTVGNASNAASAQTAVKATQDAAGNDIAATYAKQTGTYPNMSVGTASEAGYADAAASADTAGYATTAKGDASGNDIEATYATKEALTEGLAGKQPTGNYAQKNGSYPDMSVGNATKATQDASGNVITVTYATKTENNAKYTKPSTGIPKTDLASAVQASLGKADTAYQKPSAGIPKGDLASVVQTSLNKADTALQSIPLATSSAIGGVKPTTKTSEMTQSVGVDSNGALWTKEGGTTIEYMTDDEVDALFASTPSIPSFADATWEQIAQVAEAGTASNYFAVGDEKTIALSTDEQITLVILGFNHDDLSDGSGKAGITIGMKNLLATTYRMNATGTNAGGWDESEMRTSTMATLLSQLPSDLRNVIKQVNKKATAGSQSTTITTSADKLFLFALAELASKTGLENSTSEAFKNNAATFEKEGTQYEYFKNTVGDADLWTACPALVKKLSNGGGSANEWYLRSPGFGNSTYFWCVRPSGIVANTGPANNADGVSFGFCV